MEKRVERFTADKFSLRDIPKEYIPTERTIYILGVLVLLSCIISAFYVNWGAITNGDDLNISLGLPMNFFILSSSDVEKVPINYLGLTVDLILFLILGAIIDIVINVVVAQTNKAFSPETKARPKLYKRDKKDKTDLTLQYNR